MKITSEDYENGTGCVIEFENEQEIMIKNGDFVLYLEPMFDGEGNPCCISVSS